MADEEPEVQKTSIFYNKYLWAAIALMVLIAIYFFYFRSNETQSLFGILDQ